MLKEPLECAGRNPFLPAATDLHFGQERIPARAVNFLLEPQRAAPYTGRFSAGRNGSGKPRFAECAEFEEALTASAAQNGLAVMYCSS